MNQTKPDNVMIQKITKDFAVYRDDMFPLFGGGNKARKMMANHLKIQENKHNAIVTTGGIQSNHCRVVALYCKKYKLKCTLVLHGDEYKFKNQSGNAKVMRSTGARIIFCNPNEISENMDQEMLHYKKEGYNPFYLYGGGHTLEGGSTYIGTLSEIAKSDFIPDYIFVPSGSGTTQSGIMAGISKLDLDIKVIGISVGRTRKVAEKIVKAFYHDICDAENIDNKKAQVTVLDDYLCEGYGTCIAEMKELADESLYKYGFALDTTYTGKAFYGMQDMIRTKNLKGKILFWYTGGIFNYLAQ